MLICTKAILYHWAKKTNSQASSFCFWSLMTREKRKLLWSFSFFLFLFLIENLKNPYVCCCFFDFPIFLRKNGTDRLLAPLISIAVLPCRVNEAVDNVSFSESADNVDVEISNVSSFLNFFHKITLSSHFLCIILPYKIF